jgi:UDP-glucose 4-epimerase
MVLVTGGAGYIGGVTVVKADVEMTEAVEASERDCNE